jgi:O-antigen/teichoic acid export membrane protein
MKITGRLLTRNWGLNLAGQILPLGVAVAAMPYVIHGLGAERFGILSIAWTLLGFCGLLDLGLGRATTKFVAECLGRGEIEQLPAIVWTSLSTQVIVGAAGALLVVWFIPALVDRWLKVSPALAQDTKTSFTILAAALPVVIAGNAFRGVLEAAQHFHVVNYVKIPANACIYLFPALALPFGLGLPGIVWLLALVRMGTMAAYLAACLKLFPGLRRHFPFDRQLLRPLLVYGGWVTVSNLVGPLLVYMDRFFIGTLVSVAAVGYYAAPYEVVTRAWVLPASLATTIFPAFSSLQATGSAKRNEELCARSLKSILLMLGPPLLLVIAFARQILAFWLGADYAAQGTLVLQILAAGVLVNSLAQILFSLLQGLGRPDLVAKFHVIELPLYGFVLWVLLKHMGIAGAALAWTLRVSADALLLFIAMFRLKLVSWRSLIRNGLQKSTVAVSAFGALLAGFWLTGQSMWLRGLSSFFLVLTFGFGAWLYVLDPRDKEFLLSAAGQLVGKKTWSAAQAK